MKGVRYGLPFLFISLFMLTNISCSNPETESDTLESSTSELSSDVSLSTEITSQITSSEQEIEEEAGFLKNYLKQIDLKGYVGTNYKNNVKYWQKEAYRNNPNVISQIRLANNGSATSSLSDVLGTDYYGVDSYYSIDVVNKEDTNYIGWKLKALPASFGDRDLRFCNDVNAITYWNGVKQLWVHVDNSEIDAVTELRLCFEDDSIGRESYNLIEGKTLTLYSESEAISMTIKAGGYIPIPAQFVGYIAIPFNKDYYERYWSEGGNNIIDNANIAQFQIAVRATAKALNKTFYMNEFAIVGNVNGTALPVDIVTSDTYKVVWDINQLSPKTDNPKEQASSLPWYGEFVGKLLTGIAYSYKVTRDASLYESAEEIINDLSDAQGEYGYLGVFKGGARFSLEISNWDLWNHYHCILGLLEWYQITGNQKAFEIAQKALDCVYDTFRNRSYLVRGGFETNRAIAHAYAVMYQVTREDKYLDEAERIIMQDCQDINGWYKNALNGKHFYNSSSPRWEVLHMIMTLNILYEETGEEQYYNVLSYLWNDIAVYDIHNTGGFTTNEAATGNPYMEGVIETCCTIAWSAFSIEFLKCSKDVRVVDEIERSYFNGVLGALLDEDKYCTYNTPMNGVQGTAGGYDGRRVKSQQDISFQYNAGSPDMNCCQANIARGIGQLSEWAALTDKGSLYLNYYGTSTIKTIVNGSSVTIKETTNYPRDGEVKLTITDLEKDTPFVLKLRIPSWSKKGTVVVDGRSYETTPGEYFEIRRTWKNNDEVILNIGIQFTYLLGERSLADYASLYYGPILLTLDQYYQEKSGSTVRFNRLLEMDAADFDNVVVNNGNTIGAWLYIDVPHENSFIRLVDFASAGKYNGQSQPSTYYSWLNINDLLVVTPEPLDIWKIPLI